MDELNTEEMKNDIGTFLIKLREEKGLELMQIAQRTRININLLKALEETDLEKLPDLTYVKGFVKSYAKEIDADSKECIKVLEQTYANLNYKKKKLVVPKSDNIIVDNNLGLSGSSAEKITSNISIKQIAVAAGFLLVALGCFIIFRDSKPAQVNQNVNTTTTEVQDVLSNNEPSANTSEEDSSLLSTDSKPEEQKKQSLVADPEKSVEDVKETAPAETKIAAAPKEKEPKEIETKEEKQAEPGEFKLDFTVRDFKLPLFEVVPDSPDALNTDFLPEKTRNSYVEGLQNVFINAVNDQSWITYKSDSKPTKSFLLRKGRRILIRGNEIQLFMGNLKAVKIFLNNELIKAYSSSGVKSLIFPHDKSTKYKLPIFVYDKKLGKTFTLRQYLTKVKRLDLLN